MEENKDIIRLNTVRHIDPHVKAIIDTSSRTALYSYVGKDGKSWSSTDVQGTLLIYSREAPPYNMLTIINRINKSNFIESITSELDITVKSPFLLIKNSKDAIYGIWFSEQDDVERISATIRERIAEDKPSMSQSIPTIMNDPAIAMAGAGGDIMSMLSRAHGEFEGKKQEPPSCIGVPATENVNELIKPSPVRASNEASTTSEVADFFAKMGMSSGGATLPSPAAPPPSQPSAPVPSSPSTTNPVLQKLFQGAAAVGGQASVVANASVAAPTASAPIAIPGSSLQGSSTAIAATSVPPTTPVAAAPISLQELEGRLKENLLVGSHHEAEPLLLKSLLTSAADTSSLLSPQVFTSCQESTTPPQSAPSLLNTFLTPLQICDSNSSSNHAVNGSHELMTEAPSSNITPLTQEQLVQAFTILLKKDDFVQQLHEAYVKALNLSIKGCL